MKKKYRHRYYWGDILKKNREVFKEYLSELVTASLVEKNNSRRLSSELFSLCKLIYLALCNIVFPIKTLRRKNTKAIQVNATGCGLFKINLDRDNDYGIIFPIVKALDNRGEKSILIINPVCAKAHQKEIEKLKHCVLCSSKFFLKYFCITRCSVGLYKYWRYCLKAQREYKNILRVLTSGDFKTFFKKRKYLFIDEYLQLQIMADIYGVMLGPGVKYVFSLGEKPLGLYGKLNKIKVFTILHYIAASRRSFEMETANTLANADYVFAGGGEDAKNLEDTYPDTHVLVQGNPAYDSAGKLYNYPNNIKQIKSGINIILLSSSHDLLFYRNINSVEKFMEPYFGMLLEIHKKYNGSIKIAVKLHPNDSEGIYRNRSSLFGNEIKLLKGSLFEHTEKNHITIGWRTSALVESVITGTLPVQLLFNTEKCGIIEYEGMKKFYNKDRFFKYLENILNNPEIYSRDMENARKMLSKYVGNIGFAAKNIANAILEKSS